MKTWIQNLVARLFGIAVEDRERIEREKRYAFIDGQRSVITVNELLGLRAVDRKTADGRSFTVMLPQLGHAMIDDGTVYKITYAAQCPPNATASRTPPVSVPPGAFVFVALKADDDAIFEAAWIGGGT